MIFAFKRRGHTLIEILMVLAIIGMIAAISVTNFQSHHKRTNVNVTKANLESIRMAVAMFYEEEGQWPNSSLSDLVSGSPSGTQYLPAIPKEAISGTATVYSVPNYSGGWHWDPGNHVIHPNLSGSDAFGTPYSTY